MGEREKDFSYFMRKKMLTVQNVVKEKKFFLRLKNKEKFEIT
jgi:hypothetical protein